MTYLALVEDVDGRTTTAQDFRVVLIDGALGVTNRGDILDDDNVVWVLALRGLCVLSYGCIRVSRLVEKRVAGDHIIYDTALAYLLALKLRLRGQVVSIIVAEMVVRSN